MHTRRNVIQTIALGAVFSTSLPAKPTSASTIELCRKDAGHLAEAMQKLCGGQWRVSVDQKLEFVLISRVL